MVCNMALPDIADLDATVRSIARVLRPGGWLVFSLPHPCFPTPDSRWGEERAGTVGVIRGYFAEGFWAADDQRRFTALVGEHQRTLSTYVNTLAQAGLLLRKLEEPRATGEMAAR